MSKLTETKRAYAEIARLLDQEIRKAGGRARELERFRQILQSAFYLLGWAQFEHLAKTKCNDIVEEEVRSKHRGGHAWRFMKKNLKTFGLRAQLAMLFNSDPSKFDKLGQAYDERNGVAHNYKLIDARDMTVWLQELEDHVDRF